MDTCYNYAEQKKPDRIWLYLYEILENETKSVVTENISVVACGWGMMIHRGRDGWLGGWEGLQKCMKKFGGNNRYSHYLACGDGFMDVYMFRFTKWLVFWGPLSYLLCVWIVFSYSFPAFWVLVPQYLQVIYVLRLVTPCPSSMLYVANMSSQFVSWLSTLFTRYLVMQNFLFLCHQIYQSFLASGL